MVQLAACDHPFLQMGNSCCSNKHCQTTKHPHPHLLTAPWRAQQWPLQPRQHKERRSSCCWREERKGWTQTYGQTSCLLPSSSPFPSSQPSSTSESSCFLQPDPLLCFSAPLHHPPSFNPFHACLVLSCMKPIGSDNEETAQMGKTQAIKGLLQLTCPHNLKLLLEVKCRQSSVALCPHTDNQSTTELMVVLGQNSRSKSGVLAPGKNAFLTIQTGKGKFNELRICNVCDGLHDSHVGHCRHFFFI